jgi:hypothetical protein
LVDCGWRETDPVTSPRAISVFASFRFPPEVISLAVADCGPELDDMNAIITISPRRGRREYSAI